MNIFSLHVRKLLFYEMKSNDCLRYRAYNNTQLTTTKIHCNWL